MDWNQGKLKLNSSSSGGKGTHTHSSIASPLWKGHLHPINSHLILQYRERKMGLNWLILFIQFHLMWLSLCYFLCVQQSKTEGIHKELKHTKERVMSKPSYTLITFLNFLRWLETASHIVRKKLTASPQRSASSLLLLPFRYPRLSCPE